MGEVHPAKAMAFQAKEPSLSSGLLPQLFSMFSLHFPPLSSLADEGSTVSIHLHGAGVGNNISENTYIGPIPALILYGVMEFQSQPILF